MTIISCPEWHKQQKLISHSSGAGKLKFKRLADSVSGKNCFANDYLTVPSHGKENTDCFFYISPQKDN